MIQRSKKKSISLKELSELTGGEFSGSGDLVLSGVASVKQAVNGDITFLSGAKNYAAHLDALKNSAASAVIAPVDAPELPVPSIRLANPYLGLVKLLNFFYPDEMPAYGIHPCAFVSEDADVDKSACVGPMAVVEAGAKVGAESWIGPGAYVSRDCRIGQNCRINSGARILHDCIIGDNCIIHANSVIGSDGFGFTQHAGEHVKVPQIGNVIVGDNVEIGSCVTIDRATMESTLIGSGSKIDNMVHIAHNVQIGKGCIIVAQVGISGSTILEDQVTLAGQVGTVGHVRIGKGTTVAARGVVTGDVDAGSFVSGFPIKPHSEERKILASLRKLPDLIKRVRELEKLLVRKDQE